MQQEARHETRKRNTKSRNQRMKERVNALYALRIEGMRPSYEDVIAKVSAEFGYAPSTVNRILNKASS